MLPYLRRRVTRSFRELTQVNVLKTDNGVARKEAEWLEEPVIKCRREVPVAKTRDTKL